MRPTLAGLRVCRPVSFTTWVPRPASQPACMYELRTHALGGLHRNPGPTDVSTEQRGSTKQGIGGGLVSAPVCSREYPYVGFVWCPTTAFRTCTSSHSSLSGPAS